MAGSTTLHLGQAGKLGLDQKPGRLRIATGSTDQAGRRSFLVIKQRLEQMFWRETLMIIACCDGLRCLQETARPLGKFFQIHCPVPLHQATGRRQARTASPERQRRATLLVMDLGSRCSDSRGRTRPTGGKLPGRRKCQLRFPNMDQEDRTGTGSDDEP